MDSAKGKPINTSVPSIAIRFNANAEEIEELYQSEEEPPERPSNEKSRFTNVGDPEGSPLRSYLPRLGKRSTSIDASLTVQDSSPPSDPWKFFSDIKGKITKSVEETITEIKQRNQEDSSSKKTKASKDKESSSLSDSEDISESSISRTCGIMSTTEGVEMSSDDETPSLEKDKKMDDSAKPQTSSLSSSAAKHKYKFVRKKKPTKEGNIGIKHLANLYEINTGLKACLTDDKLPSQENADEVESGVEALEDDNLHQPDMLLKSSDSLLYVAPSLGEVRVAQTDEEILASLAKEIDNLEVDENNDITVKQVTGTDIRRSAFVDSKSGTYLAPEGFVDLRVLEPRFSWIDFIYNYRHLLALFAALLFYCCMSIPIYISGFIAGTMCTLAVMNVYNKFFNLNTPATGLVDAFPGPSQTILEIPAVREYQPVTKFEGWVNEYPNVYNPQTYHISQTQSVYIRLQGNVLRISHTRAKIPKRALWNEPKHKLAFTQHRIYNLLGAKIGLLPDGLNKRRHWSKKYPICITLNKDQMNFNYSNITQESLELEDDKKTKCSEVESSDSSQRSGFLRKKKINHVQPQIFSKLTEEEEEFEMESGSSRPSSPSPPEEPSPDISEEAKVNENVVDEDDVEELLKDVFDEDQEEDVLSFDEWSTFTPEQDSPTETHIYIFGRTDREKEDWFRRLLTATHKGAHLNTSDGASVDSIETKESISDTLITAAQSEAEYLKFMARFQKTPKGKHAKVLSEQIEHASDVLWINALLGRVLFDCIGDEVFITRVKERIQRKLSSIKLPYFIEQLGISELSLGNNPPLIHKASKPVLDQRGLWVDLDITYEGVTVLTLQTKLNLMKLKQPPSNDTAIIVDNATAKWQNSDVDDTAESSTDDDTRFTPATGKVLDESGNPITGLGGTSNTSKKFIKMVDKIAESKFFQAATENRYIKKAMEGVSNTDLSLKVEVKGLVGTLVLNIPPPPTDRVWIGFRPAPKLWLTAQPIVGERNISFLRHLTAWIEKKLSQEFQKLLVIPNMEDITIPVMSGKLPE